MKLSYISFALVAGVVASVSPNHQPTNQPSSIYIAPSVPEDVSSNIVDSPSLSAPTITVGKENQIGSGNSSGGAINGDDIQSDLNYVLLVIITIIALLFLVFMYRRYVEF